MRNPGHQCAKCSQRPRIFIDSYPVPHKPCRDCKQLQHISMSQSKKRSMNRMIAALWRRAPRSKDKLKCRRLSSLVRHGAVPENAPIERISSSQARRSNATKPLITELCDMYPSLTAKEVMSALVRFGNNTSLHCYLIAKEADDWVGCAVMAV